MLERVGSVGEQRDHQSKSLKAAQGLCRRRPIGASDPACYVFGSGRSFEKLSAAAGEGAPGSTNTGCEEKVMVRIHHCSSGIHASPAHLEGGDFAEKLCGGQLAPARR